MNIETRVLERRFHEDECEKDQNGRYVSQIKIYLTTEIDPSAHLQGDLGLNVQRLERSIRANSRTWWGNVLKVEVLGLRVGFGGCFIGPMVRKGGSPTNAEFIDLHKQTQRVFRTGIKTCSHYVDRSL